MVMVVTGAAIVVDVASVDVVASVSFLIFFF
jgi:hypothetical protein